MNRKIDRLIDSVLEVDKKEASSRPAGRYYTLHKITAHWERYPKVYRFDPSDAQDDGETVIQPYTLRGDDRRNSFTVEVNRKGHVRVFNSRQELLQSSTKLSVIIHWFRSHIDTPY